MHGCSTHGLQPADWLWLTCLEHTKTKASQAWDAFVLFYCLVHLSRRQTLHSNAARTCSPPHYASYSTPGSVAEQHSTAIDSCCSSV